ncbi:MAG: exo-alpha-sialidase [Pseudomonadota bacterium]
MAVTRFLAVLSVYCLLVAFGPLDPDTTLIAHSPNDSGNFIGSPSILVLQSGRYLVSHDFFGDGPKANSTDVYFSRDGGESWQLQASLPDQFWSGLFEHRGGLYLIGTRGEFGPVVIRRSLDMGRTWTQPDSPQLGVLTDDRPYHGAAVPVIEYGQRLWRGFEFKGDRVLVLLSASVDATLLERSHWRQVELSHDGSASTWLEGNLVVAPDGALVSVLRREFADDTAAVVKLSEDGSRFKHDSEVDVIQFPGGGSKFTIRYDKESGRYWSIVNQQTDPDAFRNHLVLTSSKDLYHWQIERRLAFHPDAKRYSWQYADWQIDGEDLVAVLRMAGDFGGERPSSAYLSNLLGFLRVENFRDSRD